MITYTDKEIIELQVSIEVFSAFSMEFIQLFLRHYEKVHCTISFPLGFLHCTVSYDFAIGK